MPTLVPMKCALPIYAKDGSFAIISTAAVEQQYIAGGNQKWIQIREAKHPNTKIPGMYPRSAFLSID